MSTTQQKQLVYLLEHIHELEDGSEDSKRIGLFSTREKAEVALDRVRDQPGFRDYPQGFEISEYELDPDRLNWSEGFVTIRPGEYLDDDRSDCEYLTDLSSVGEDIYFECSLCGSACPTSWPPDSWQCSCGNVRLKGNERSAEAGNGTIKIFRLKRR